MKYIVYEDMLIIRLSPTFPVRGTLLALAFTFLVSGLLLSQKVQTYSDIDRVVLGASSRETQTSEALADFIGKKFTSESDRSRAIYAWIVNNIKYDVANMYNITPYASSTDVVKDVLRQRKGVCMHYAELYAEVANRLGILTLVVPGYTRQNDAIDEVPHAWCATMIDGAWQLLDPTWGAGYLQNSKFVFQLNDYFYRTPPVNLVKSHMPFDPMWQMLPQPVDHESFFAGTMPVAGNQPVFHFADTLQDYLGKSRTEQLQDAGRRIVKSGISNPLMAEALRYNEQELVFIAQRGHIDLFNDAVTSFNTAIDGMNALVAYRNRQFTPAKSDNDLRAMADAVADDFRKVRMQLEAIHPHAAESGPPVKELQGSLDEAEATFQMHATFVQKYLDTPEANRKALFQQSRSTGSR